MDEDGIEAARGKQALDAPREGGRVEVAEGGRPSREPEETEARPAAEPRHAPDVQVGAVAAELLGIGPLLGRARQRGHRHLVRAREVADHVERTDLPSALGRVRHPVTEEEDLHGEAKGAPRGA